MVAEGVAPALDLLLGDNDVAGVGERGEERGGGGVEDAVDGRVAHNVNVVEHRKTVHRGLLGGALEGVLDVLRGDGATVLILTLLELGVAAQVEGVGKAVIADRPVGREHRDDLGEVHVVVNERVAYAVDDLGLVGARVENGVKVLGRGGQRDHEGASRRSSTCPHGGRRIGAAATSSKPHRNCA